MDSIEGFTKKYKVHRLVYYEAFGYVQNAIRREKQLKGWRREKKIALIEKTNPRWRDLPEHWGREMRFRGQPWGELPDAAWLQKHSRDPSTMRPSANEVIACQRRSAQDDKFEMASPEQKARFRKTPALFQIVDGPGGVLPDIRRSRTGEIRIDHARQSFHTASCHETSVRARLQPGRTSANKISVLLQAHAQQSGAR